MKVRFDWQKKTIVIFAVTISLLSILLTIFAIRAAERESVFEKFYRSEYLHDSSIRGSGIGLTLVAHIVKAHGGEVLLESDLGKGTEVTMRLPVSNR